MKEANASKVKVYRKPEPALVPPKTEPLRKEVSAPIQDEAKAFFSKPSSVEPASQQTYTPEPVTKPEVTAAPLEILQEQTRKPPSQEVSKVESDRKEEPLPKPSESREAEQAKKQEPPKMKPTPKPGPAPVTHKKEAYSKKGIQIIKLCKTNTALKIPCINGDKQYNLLHLWSILFFLCLCSLCLLNVLSLSGVLSQSG